jgi:hypothetical protein
MTALELDAAKVRVMKSAQKSGMFARKKGSFMKSRVALVAVLALGVFMSGTGATLAVSGFANNGSASSAQYPNENPKKPHHIVEAKNESGSECTGNGGNGGNSGAGGNGGNGSKNCNEPSTEPVEAEVETQAVEQAAVTGSSSSLPFTGFLAIPVLIIGLGLLGAGVAMRVRTRRGNHVA